VHHLFAKFHRKLAQSRTIMIAQAIQAQCLGAELSRERSGTLGTQAKV
jgi:hypothetical protein